MRPYTLNFRVARATMLATIITAVSMASAEAQASGPLTILGRVVLGLGGGESVAIETPQAVTVLDQDDIDREAATTIGELLDDVPGAQAIGTGNVTGSSYNIRGIGSTVASDESRIIVNVDGATKFYEQYRVGSFFSDPELYKRVEVLRGPASSTLYGPGALGGVIALETKDPSDFLQDGDSTVIRPKIGYQSNGGEALGSVIFATKIGGHSEALLALNRRQSDEYVDGDGEEITGSAFESTSALAKYKAFFGNDSKQSMTFALSVWDSALEDTTYSTIDVSNFGTVDRHTRDLTASARYRNPNGLAGGETDVTLAYSNTSLEQTNASGTTMVRPTGPGQPPAVIPLTCANSGLFCDSDYAYRTTSLEVKNTNSFGLRNWENYLTTGLQFAHQSRIAESTAGPFVYHPEGTDSQVGIFAELEAIQNDRLSIIPGIRLDRQQLSPPDEVDSTQVEHTTISPKVAAHYKLSGPFAVFGSLAQTQRVPTLDEVYGLDSRGTTAPSPELDPEVANTIEVGFSASLLDLIFSNDAAQIKVTGFTSDIQDLINFNGAPAQPTNTNDGSAKIQGFEIEGGYDADKAFGRLAYSNVSGEDEDGNTLDSIPANALALTVGGRAVNQTLEYGWRGKFVSEIKDEDDEEFSAYDVHDVFIDWMPDQGALRGVKVGFSISNVFDTVYRDKLGGDANGQGQSFNLMLSKAF